MRWTMSKATLTTISNPVPPRNAVIWKGMFIDALIAVVPTAVHALMEIPFEITAFLGGTGLLIVVSVALDMVQRIEANLLMRNYSGFLSAPGHKGKRIKGRQY